MSTERNGVLLRAVFELLAKEGATPAARVIEEVGKGVALTADESSFYPNRPNVRRFEKRTRFATIPAVKAGWLAKSDGLWRLTADGESALQRHQDPTEFYQEAKTLYREWADARPPSGQPNGAEEDDAQEVEIVATFEEAEENSRTLIKEYLHQIPPYEFQDLVAALLRGMGYHVAWIAQGGADGGVDIVAYGDPLGVAGSRVKVEVKRREGAVDVNQLKSFLSNLGGHDVGIYVSLGGFTSAAETVARTDPNRRITLVDFSRLLALWIEHYRKLPFEDQQRLPVRPVYYLSPRS